MSYLTRRIAVGSQYTHLTITERRKIERWRHAKVPVDEIAHVLNRSRSTIFRELRRNRFADKPMRKHDGYYGSAAQLMAADWRSRQRKVIQYPSLCKSIIDRLKNGSLSGFYYVKPCGQRDTRANQQSHDP